MFTDYWFVKFFFSLLYFKVCTTSDLNRSYLVCVLCLSRYSNWRFHLWIENKCSLYFEIQKHTASILKMNGILSVWNGLVKEKQGIGTQPWPLNASWLLAHQQNDVSHHLRAVQSREKWLTVCWMSVPYTNIYKKISVNVPALPVAPH